MKLKKKLLLTPGLLLLLLAAGCHVFSRPDDSDSSQTGDSWCTFGISLEEGQSRAAAGAVAPVYDKNSLYYRFSVEDAASVLTVYPESGFYDYDFLKETTFTLLTGGYTFTLDAYSDGEGSVRLLSCQKAVTLTAGTSFLSFDLASPESVVTTGSVSVTVTFPATANIQTVSVSRTLLSDRDTVLEEQTLVISSSDGTCSVTYTAAAIEAGSYILFFYLTDASGNRTVIPELVVAAAGVVSSNGDSPLALDDVTANTHYALSFENMTDGDTSCWAAGVTIPLAFVQKQEVTLPGASSFAQVNRIFAGWYESADFSGEPVASFTGGSESKTFYARWISPVLYVAENGSDSNDGLSQDSPLASLGQAVGNVSNTLSQTVSKYADLNTVGGSNRAAALDWTVYVSGTVSVSSATAIGTPSAASLRIAGLTGLDAGGVPQDLLSGETTVTSALLSISSTVPVTIADLKISGGKGYNGGAINNTGNLILSDGLLLAGNEASNGSAVYSSGTLTVEGSACISENTVTSSNVYSGGTVYVSGGSLTMTGGSISNNTASDLSGGGIYVSSDGTATISGGSISSNSAASGGGIYSAGTLTLSDEADVRANTATNGGGIYVSSDGTATISGGCISGNTASSNGGGVYNAGILTMSGGIISSNTASSTGGGMFNEGSLFMYGSAVIGDSSKTECATDTAYSNKATDGGSGIRTTSTVYLGYSDASTKAALTGGVCYNASDGISILCGTVFMDSGSISYNYGRGLYVGSNDGVKYGNFTMSGGEVSGNGSSGTDCGGGIYAGYHGKVKLEGGSISSNTAQNGGGLGLKNCYSSLDMSGGSISSNRATGNGGGIYAEMDTSYTGYIKMSGGSISSNTASSNGGGVHIAYGPFTMSGGEITGNSSSSYGGGICNAGSLAITGGTISANTATTGGGGIAVWGTLKMGEAAYIPAGDEGKNDVFLYSGGTKYAVTIASLLTQSAVATLTPGDYTAGRTMLTLAADASTTVAANYTKFAVTQPASGTDWRIDSKGLLQVSVSATVSVTLPSAESDIGVSKSVSGSVVTFTAESGYASYSWTIDDTDASSVSGVTVSSDGSTLTVDTSGWTAGSYDLVLEAATSGGTLYSYTAQIRVE